jgi:hypothetical protein
MNHWNDDKKKGNGTANSGLILHKHMYPQMVQRKEAHVRIFLFQRGKNGRTKDLKWATGDRASKPLPKAAHNDPNERYEPKWEKHSKNGASDGKKHTDLHVSPFKSDGAWRSYEIDVIHNEMK